MYENQLGQTVAQYILLEKIEENPIGTFFHGRSVDLSRDVTVLLFNPDITRVEAFDERLNALIQVNSRFSEPGLTRMIEAGRTNDFSYVVLEWLPGDSLKQLLEKMKAKGSWISLGEGVRLVRQLALTFENTRLDGYHRRVDPGRIHFRYSPIERLPYTPVIDDWSLESLIQDPAKQNFLLAPVYMSPEECIGQAGDPRSSVYSLGILLYELATGQTPFPIQGLSDATRFHTRQPVAPPVSLRPELPLPLQNVILKALQKNPANRYSSLVEFAEELNWTLPLLEGLIAPPPIFEKTESLVSFYLESLGDYRTVVETQTTPTPPKSEPVQSEPTTSQTEGLPSGPEIEMVLEQTQLSVEPGRNASTAIAMHYRGATPAIFRVTVTGIPASWVTLSSGEVSLETNIQKTIQLVIRPPRITTTRPGRYNVTIRVSDKQKVSRFTQAELKLSVGVFNYFKSELESTTISSGRAGRVTITNAGNVTDTFTISCVSLENDLKIEPEKSQVRLNPGQVGQADFQVSVRVPRLFGGESTHPFQVSVVSASGQLKKHDCTYISRALLPTWALISLIVLCLCVTTIGIIYISNTALRNTKAEQTSVALYTGTYYSVQNTNVAATQTADFLVNANAATRQSITQTVLAITNQAATEQLISSETVLAATSTYISQNATLQANATLANQATQTLQIQQTQHASFFATATSLAIEATAQSGTAKTATAQAGLVQTVTAQAALFYTATAQAGIIQTATAQAALFKTATAQAGFIQTVTAQAGNIQTLTAQAPPPTSTPTPTSAQVVPTATFTATATPVPQGARIAYIYTSNSGLANDYKTFLGNYGYTVDLIPVDAIPSVNFSLYQTILIAPDTGANGDWGDPNGIWVTSISNSNLPVLGLGEGGFDYFGKIKLPIGFPNGIDSSSDSILALNTGDPVWSTPNSVGLTEDGIIILYDKNTGFYASNLQDPIPGNIIPYGKWPANVNQFPIIRQDNRYVLWGFSGSPKNMTNPGKSLFLNLLYALIKVK